MEGGSIIKDLQNIQSELGYTSDDTYLFNYKNKEKDLEKLLYKLSKYEKECKLSKNKKLNKTKELNKTKKLSKNKKLKKGGSGGIYSLNNIPELKYIPVLGNIFLENNYIQLYDNTNLVSDLIIFQINHIVNILELFCILNILYLYTSNKEINYELLFVTGVVYFCRIIISSSKCKKSLIKLSNELNNFILLLVIGIPLFLLLINNEYYENKYNIAIAFMVTLLTIPYFRLLYNKFNKFDKFNFKSAFIINILEKIVCAILLYVIIINNYNLDSILKYIFIDINDNIKLEKNDEKIFENINYDDQNNHILLNNFKKIFDK